VSTKPLGFAGGLSSCAPPRNSLVPHSGRNSGDARNRPRVKGDVARLIPSLCRAVRAGRHDWAVATRRQPVQRLVRRSLSALGWVLCTHAHLRVCRQPPPPSPAPRSHRGSSCQVPCRPYASPVGPLKMLDARRPSGVSSRLCLAKRHPIRLPKPRVPTKTATGRVALLPRRLLPLPLALQRTPRRGGSDRLGYRPQNGPGRPL